MLLIRTPKLFLLGPPRIEVDGQPIHLERQKSVALLAYLVVTGRTHSRDWLATLLWPDVSTSRTQLRKSLADIRQKLGDYWLHVTWDDVGFKDDIVWSDVGELMRASVDFTQGKTAPLLNINYMLHLYPQQLLNGFTLRDTPDFDDWQRVEEQNLRSRYEQLMDFAVTQFIQQSKFQSALTLTQHWVTINPYNEHARRQLIRLYVWTNQRGVALREYQSLRNAIWEDYRAEPEQETLDLFQQLQGGMPAARANRQRSRLPMVAPLIGRGSELQLLTQMVNEGVRLITITGPGGVGKTHLAITIALALESKFVDGCFLVNLESSTNSRTLINALAQALSVPTNSEQDLPSVVYDFLRTKRALIVLDSIHHVNEAQWVIQAVLNNAPQIVLILTSYHALDMNSEYYFPLRGLELENDKLGVNESAVQLFVQSARRVLPNFQLTAENFTDISHICQLIEGMPLGILLASAWCAVLSPREIAEEIEANYDFLQVTHRDVPERHQSLRAVFESAWQWLSADEQQALMNLSIFPESFTRKAAEYIAFVRLATLKGLTSKALVSFTPAKQRYILHDVSRQYVGEKLMESGTQADIRARYQHFYAQYLIERNDALRSHLKETTWQEIEREFTHIRAAWRSILADRNFSLILQMMEPLHLFLRSRGWEQGLLLFDEARQIAAVSDESRSLYYKLMVRFFPAELGMKRWLSDLQTAMEIATIDSDALEVAYLHGEFGWYDLSLGDYADARMHFSQAEVYYRAVDDNYALAAILRGIAYSDIALGEHKTAEQHTKESLRLRRIIGDHEGEHETLMLEAELALLTGDINRAGLCFQMVYNYFRSRYTGSSALLRSFSMGWYWTFNRQFEEAHTFADQVLQALTSEQAAIVICTAHAIKLATYGLQNNRDLLQSEIEQIEDLLRKHPIWDSTSNSDMRFLIDFSLLLGYTQLGQQENAFKILKDLAKSGRLHHPVYFTWLVPVLIVLVSTMGHHNLVKSLTAFHRRSFLASAKWAELQAKLDGAVPDGSNINGIHQIADAVLNLAT